MFPAVIVTVLLIHKAAPPPGADQFPQALGLLPPPHGSPPVAEPQFCLPGSLVIKELNPVEPGQPLQLQAIELPFVLQLVGLPVIFQSAQS